MESLHGSLLVQVSGAIDNLQPKSTICLRDAVWLGQKKIATNEFFVRPAYIELLHAREQYLVSRKFLDRPGTTIFTGTPGELSSL